MVFVAASDVHYGYCDEEGMLPIIREVNAMMPRPAFFVITGDLICSASIAFGNRPDGKQKAKAVEEFCLFKKHLDSVSPAIPVRLVLGNHDTYPGEVEPELFHRVFPDRPAYQSFDVAGVHFVALNGHSTGYIDGQQRDWLTADIARVPTGRTIVTFVHQPALQSTVAERGISQAVGQAFAGRTGELWLVAGHIHANADAVFALPKTTIVQASICNSTKGKKVWGSPEMPGYWVYCLCDGHIVARIFRKLGEGYRLQKQPNLAHAQPMPRPWDGIQGIRWKLMVGEGDREYLLSARAGDCLDWWSYVRELVYRLPLAKARGKVSRLALLAALDDTRSPKTEKVFVSSAGKEWTELPLGNRVQGVYTMAIPENLRNQNDLRVKVCSGGNGIVAGFAMLE